MLVTIGTASTQVLVSTMGERMLLFTSIDRSFVIEAALCRAILGTEGDNIMENKIVAAFPSDPNFKKLDITAQELKIIRDSPVARCTGPAAASMLQAAVEVVEGMLRGFGPQQKFMTSGIMQKLSPTLLLFCQTAITIKGKTSIIIGQAAMKELVKTIQEKKDSEEAEALCYSDLEHLHAFQWLLNEAELVVFESLTTELVSIVMAPKGGTKFQKGASKAKVFGGKLSKGHGDMAFAGVMSLFHLGCELVCWWF